MSNKRKQAIKKIIREELTAHYEKFLVEGGAVRPHNRDSFPMAGVGVRGAEGTLPEPAEDRAIAPNKKRSTVTSIVDEPDATNWFVEEKISGHLSEQAPAEGDEQLYGINTTNNEPPEVQAADLNYNLEDPPRDLPPETHGAPAAGEGSKLDTNIKFESKSALTESEIRYFKKLAKL